MKGRLAAYKQISLTFSLATVALGVWGSPTLAGDPFRQSNAANIGEKTEAAFEAVFRQGNYKEAKNYLIEADSAETNEPLAHAMRASLAYTEKDWETLKSYASKTIETAEQLKTQNPVRGNIYLAVGHFLEGAYIYKQQQDPVSTLTKLQQVFQFLDAAEQESPDDPELNLVKGYLELILAVNLPFSSPDQAIARLEQYAAPKYLVDRGIAVAYRDLKEYDKAMQFAEQALNAAPENPELYYLKGQILRKQGKQNQDLELLKQAFSYFEKTLAKQEQLPESILAPVRHERELLQKEMNEFQAYRP
jgi:tetratricopeptide (TPR) repeat protein